MQQVNLRLYICHSLGITDCYKVCKISLSNRHILISSYTLSIFLVFNLFQLVEEREGHEKRKLLTRKILFLPEKVNADSVVTMSLKPKHDDWTPVENWELTQVWSLVCVRTFFLLKGREWG